MVELWRWLKKGIDHKDDPKINQVIFWMTALKALNMHRVGTNFWLKIGNFFLENLFQILKKPFGVKRSSDSKYASLMRVSRREVHEF